MAWSPLQEVVSLEQLKNRLKLPLDSPGVEDDDLSLILEIAHEVCFDFLTQRVSDADIWEATVDTWTADTAPRRVVGAILAQAVSLYRFRGDDLQVPARVEGAAICDEAAWLLKRLRDPAVS